MFVTKRLLDKVWYACSVFATGQIGAWTTDRTRAQRIDRAQQYAVSRFAAGHPESDPMQFEYAGEPRVAHRAPVVMG